MHAIKDLAQLEQNYTTFGRRVIIRIPKARRTENIKYSTLHIVVPPLEVLDPIPRTILQTMRRRLRI